MSKRILWNAYRLNLSRYQSGYAWHSRLFSSCRATRAPNPQHLRRPNYNVKDIANDPQKYIESCELRRLPNEASLIPDIVENYLRINKTRAELSEHYKERKVKQRLVMRATPEERRELLASLETIKQSTDAGEKKIEALNEELYSWLHSIPNLLPDDCPISEEEVDHYICTPPPSGSVPVINENEFAVPIDCKADYPDHVEIGTKLGIIDLKTASKISGHAFYYLIGDGAMLEHALVQYALSRVKQYGFKVMLPPSVVRREYALACGFRPRDADGERQIYNLSVAGGNPIEDEEVLCLTGTAEIPLAAYNSERELRAAELPLKLAGVSRSYRAEAGGRGRDTRGIYRVHEFTKVELFAWVDDNAEDVVNDQTPSAQMLESLRELQEKIISDLGLYCRILNMPANDLGASAYKKYDIEAWMPGRKGWGEITSASNCTDYQARRLHTRVKHANGSLTYAHTLNGTAMAVPRVIVAILENFYDPQREAVWIPKPLRRYMDDRVWIEKQ
ncbi:uncharacterized protein V1516DRAFT_672614 [Lipomyces oligophaga]|uniref:uncharacterized protein n=1 Tax=Lipomyces oligophaga TaxID=45792 RepID=UPI0034CF9946